MKIKISVTLSKELVEQIDNQLTVYGTRSNLIEVSVRSFLETLARHQQGTRDIEIIDENADRLNAEALDVLTYQAELSQQS